MGIVKNKLSQLREEQNKSQAELARIMGVAQSQISKDEIGKLQMTFHKARLYAKALNCKASDLLPDEDYRLRLNTDEEQLIKEFRKTDSKYRSHILMHFRMIAETIDTISTDTEQTV